MRLLLDTHILLCAVANSSKLSVAARALIGDLDNALIFSSVSLWEVAIKSGRHRDDFRIDVSSLRRNLLDKWLRRTCDDGSPCCGANRFATYSQRSLRPDACRSSDRREADACNFRLCSR